MTMPAHHCLKPAAIALVIWATAQPMLAYAQDAATPTLSMPFGECALGQWTSNRNLDDRTSITNAARRFLDQQDRMTSASTTSSPVTYAASSAA